MGISLNTVMMLFSSFAVFMPLTTRKYISHISSEPNMARPHPWSSKTGMKAPKLSLSMTAYAMLAKHTHSQ